MNQKQFAHLLSTATALCTTLEFQHKQAEEFTSMALAYSAEINNRIATTHINIQAIAANPPPLSKSDAEILSKLKSSLLKITQDLNKSIEKPLMQHQKEADDAQKKINERLLPELLKPCTFSLDPIRNQIVKAQELITKINRAVDRCLPELNKCQNKVAQARTDLQRINLPNEIEDTTKEVVKVTNELVTINQQLLENPAGRTLYQKNFLPLFAALDGLRIQSEVITSTTPQIRPDV